MDTVVVPTSEWHAHDIATEFNKARTAPTRPTP